MKEAIPEFHQSLCFSLYKEEFFGKDFSVRSTATYEWKYADKYSTNICILYNLLFATEETGNDWICSVLPHKLYCNTKGFCTWAVTEQKQTAKKKSPKAPKQLFALLLWCMCCSMPQNLSYYFSCTGWPTWWTSIQKSQKSMSAFPRRNMDCYYSITTEKTQFVYSYIVFHKNTVNALLQDTPYIISTWYFR